MFHENNKLIGKEQIEKQIKEYLNYDKKLNALDLQLWQTEDYFFDVVGKSEQERVLLGFLEKEIHNLQYTINCLKNEFENNRYILEEMKGKEED